MKKSLTIEVSAVGVLILATLLVAGTVAAQDAPEMSAEEAAMMEAFQKAATPGEEHAWLTSLAGDWEFTGQYWMAPGGPATEFSGTAKRTVLLGGRVVREDVTSVMMGQPFHGLSLTGFDNVTRSYWSTWTDNMSTGVMLSKGLCDGGTCTFEGSAADPMTGKMTTSRMVSKHKDDREVHSMYGPGPDGEEFKMMEFVYTRKK